MAGMDGKVICARDWSRDNGAGKLEGGERTASGSLLLLLLLLLLMLQEERASLCLMTRSMRGQTRDRISIRREH